jgi:hypothetical protein
MVGEEFVLISFTISKNNEAPEYGAFYYITDDSIIIYLSKVIFLTAL